MNESKFWFWVLLDALIAAVTIGVLGVAFPTAVRWEASLPPARTITVSAQGKTTAAPDLAEISFSVVSTGKDPQSLTESNVAKMNAALSFLSAQGIATSDITTTGYDLSPAYNYDNSTQRNYITGYTLTQTVSVKVHDLSKVADVLGGLTPLGVNQVGGVDFTFNNSDDYVALARADAIAKDRAKAQEMASASGVKLGAVMNVSENVYLPVAYKAYSMSSGMGGMAVPEAAAVPSLQAGTQDITDNVSMTYTIY